MATVAEIVLKYRDQFSEQAKRDLLKFEQQHKRTMNSAKDSADILKDTLGIHLPKELTKLVAQSQLIGPALAASFSVIAAIGFIGVLSQIPELFKKLSGAITGWDEVSKKAYEKFLDDNKKAVAAAEQFRLKMIEIRSGSAAAMAASVEEQTRVNLGFAAGIAALNQKRDELRAKNVEAAKTEKSGGRPTPLRERAAAVLPNLSADDEAQLKHLKTLLAEGGQGLKELETQQTIATAEENKKRLEEERKHRAEIVKLEDAWYLMVFNKEQEALEAQLKAQEEHEKAVQNLLQVTEEMQWANWDARRKRESEEQKASEQWFADQETMAQATRDIYEEIFKHRAKEQEDMQKKRDEFMASFREGANRVWDAFYTRGESELVTLANLTKRLFDTIGRTLFQDFAAGLLTGKRTTGGGIAGTVGNLGASVGLGKILGGSSGGLLGGLLGGGAATAAPLVTTIGSSTVLTGGALGLSAGAPAATGIAGALGLGGGAGLLGLGAATIPVFGAAAVGTFFLLKHFFGHKTIEAVFTKDPNAVEKSRTIFFFTGMTDALDRFSNAVNRLSTMSPGVLVKQGMPQALESSNQFRRKVAGTLLDDDI